MAAATEAATTRQTRDDLAMLHARVLARRLDAAIEAVALASKLCASVQETLVDEETAVKKDRSPVTIADYGALLQATADLLRPLVQHDTNVLGIGLSTPGLIAREQQRVIFSPNLPATNGHSLAADLATELGAPCFMLQESHALCLAGRRVLTQPIAPGLRPPRTAASSKV